MGPAAIGSYLTRSVGRRARSSRSRSPADGGSSTGTSRLRSLQKRSPAHHDLDLARARVLVLAKQVQSLAVGRDVVLGSPVTEPDRWKVHPRRQSKSWRAVALPIAPRHSEGGPVDRRKTVLRHRGARPAGHLRYWKAPSVSTDAKAPARTLPIAPTLRTRARSSHRQVRSARHGRQMHR